MSERVADFIKRTCLELLSLRETLDAEEYSTLVAYFAGYFHGEDREVHGLPFDDD